MDEKPAHTYVILACRYWRLTQAQFLETLVRAQNGERFDAAEFADRHNINPRIGDRVPEAARAGIPWQDGGIRNFDKPNLPAIEKYLAGTLK